MSRDDVAVGAMGRDGRVPREMEELHVALGVGGGALVVERAPLLVPVGRHGLSRLWSPGPREGVHVEGGGRYGMVTCL